MINHRETPDYDQVWKQTYGDMQNIGPVHRHMHRIVETMLKQIEYESILDVGCGLGHNLSLLTQGRRLKRISGLDISPWAIEQARKSGEGDFHLMDIQQKRLEGNWDLVYCSLVLEHMPDDLAALRNIRSMTGRYFLASTIAGDFERYKAWDIRMGHVRNYQVGELEEKLVKAGFVVQKVVYWGYPFYTPIGRLVQNRGGMGTNEFGLVARLAAKLLYYLYFLNSHKRGDLLVVLASVQE